MADVPFPGAIRPAEPQPRSEPLPEQRPKPRELDRAAPEMLARILESPTYRRADEDVAFLNADETRGVRLQIDYLKPQLELERTGVQHTIVVFGGTRVLEPLAAEERLHELQRALEATPDAPGLLARVKRAERVRAKSHYYDVARDFGRLVARTGQGPDDCRLMVVTGGGPGIMEAANRGAHDMGSKTIGLNIDLPHEQFPNPYVTPELCFRFHYFGMRKLHFLLRARALVAFPGGYGTLDELFETLTLIQTRKIRPMPVVLVGEAFWRRIFDADFLLDEGMIDPEDRELFWFAEDAETIWSSILAWYQANGGGTPGAPCF